MTKNKIKKFIMKCIIEMGKKSPSSIRKFMKKNGVVGELDSTKSCPIANYIKKRTREKFKKTVKFDVMYSDLMFENGDYISLPKNCEKFIENFDDAKYKELVK